MYEERELQWDDVIEKEGSEFATLPEGDYTFMVESFERGRFTPKEGNKLPACNMATLKLRIDTPEGAAYINHQLYLHTKMESRLSEFLHQLDRKRRVKH